MSRFKTIVRPQGIDLLNHINAGTPICNECGAIMEREKDPGGGCDILVCPDCGDEIDEMDYKYHDGEEEEYDCDDY